MVYGDPEPVRMFLPLFQTLTLENFHWKGATTDQQGNTIDIDVTIKKVELDQSIPYPNPNLNAKNVDFHLTIGDLADVIVRANKLSGRIEYERTYMDMNALNITAVLEGNVELGVYATVLPWPLPLKYVLYSFTGDRIRFSMVVVKPIEVSITKPLDGTTVQGYQDIVATIKTAPGISAENVRWEVDGQWGPMHPVGGGVWKGDWPSHHTWNGWHSLVVRADGVDRKSGYEFRYPAEARINVEVDNPWVVSYVQYPDRKEEFGLEIGTSEGPRWTRFNFCPWVGYTLNAPPYWWDGNIKFKCWTIEGTGWSSGDPTLTIDATVLGMLFDASGRARQLECVYVPAPPP